MTPEPDEATPVGWDAMRQRLLTRVFYAHPEADVERSRDLLGDGYLDSMSVLVVLGLFDEELGRTVALPSARIVDTVTLDAMGASTSDCAGAASGPDIVVSHDDTPAAGVLLPDGDSFVPTTMAQGPWGSTIGGNFVGGILGHVLENAVEDHGLQPARLTVDLLRPAAMGPLRGRTSIVREGRRLTLVEAELLQRDAVVARATGLFLRKGEHRPGEIWTSPLKMPPVPPTPAKLAAGAPLLIWAYGRNPDVAGRSFDLTEWQHDGPKFVWVRDLVPLVEGVPTTPFTRAIDGR